ncbi:hypothetical protein D3C72_1851880 [compost metagenome]
MRSCTVIGRRAGTLSSTGLPSAPGFSMPTVMRAYSGRYIATGSSSFMRPSSTSIIAATVVMGLLIE